MLLALLIASFDQASDRFFDALILANQKRTSGRVTASQIGVENGRKFSSRYEVSYLRPSALRIDMGGPSKKTLWANPDGITVLDSATKRYGKTPWNPRKTLAENVIASGATVDSLVMALVEPSLFRQTIETMKSANLWTFKSGVAGVVALASGPNGRISVTKMPNGDLTDLEIQSKANSIHWTFRYGPAPTSLSARLPKDAVRIQGSAVAEKGSPKYLDNTSRILTERAFDAYDLLNRVAYKVIGAEGTTKVWYDGDYVRESNTQFEFVYKPGSFLVLDRDAHKAYKGNVRFAEVKNLMDKAHLSWDSLMRELLRGRNPLRAMLSPQFRASKAGSLVVEGHKCTVIRYLGPKVRLSLLIRDKDGLVMRTTSDALDASAKVVSTSDRTYNIMSYRLPVARSNFEVPVPQGYEVLDLGRLPGYR